ncbi:MAG: diacylglycerol/polyprenol kinase family protein [Candidatus Asgardarchaeia archaeon]
MTDLTFTLDDLLVMLVAYSFVVIIIGVGEFLRGRLKLPTTFTRKLIHLFAGFSIYTIPYYPSVWPATIVALTFVVLLYLSTPKSPIKRLSSWFYVMADREEEVLAGHIYGPFYYAISITVLVSIYTFQIIPVENFYVSAACLTIMYLGDGMAATIGVRWGKHKYKTAIGGQKSVEGSVAMFLFGFLGALIGLWFFGILNYGKIDLLEAFTLAFLSSLIATFIEAVSPSGVDNLSVPLLTALVTNIIHFQIGI